MSKAQTGSRPAGTTAILFRTTVAQLLPEPDGVQTKIISAYVRALSYRVDRRRNAKSGKTAVGFETLSATATALFGAALAELGFNRAHIADHGAGFGIAVRGLVSTNWTNRH